MLKSLSLASLSSHFNGRLLGGLLLLNLLGLGLAARAIYDDRMEREGQARVSVQNISLLLERETNAVFDRVDLGLHTVVDEVESQIANGRVNDERLNAFLKHHQGHLPETVSLRVTDANGRVRHGEGVLPTQEINLRDREFFILQRENLKAGPVIGKPLRDRINQAWSIPVSRRVNRPGGEFAGIVYINIPVAYFVKKFASLELGPHGLVALRSAELISMARYPEVQEGGGVVGQVAHSEQLRDLFKTQRSSATYVARSPSDEIERTFSYNKLANYPLFLIVGMARQDYLAEWWRDTAQTVVVLLLFTVMTSLFAWLMSRSWRRQLLTNQALRESEQRWSLALESGGFSVWDWNLQTGEVQLSRLGKQLFGFAEDEVGSRMADWESLCHPDDKAHVLARMKAHFRHRVPGFEAEFRVRCKDGSWKWILARGLVVNRAEDGRPLRMIGTHEDISLRHQREEEQRLAAAVFNIADEAMVVTSPRNEIISVNPAFTAITGYEPQEVIGRNPRLLSAKTHSKAFYQEMWAKLVEMGYWSGEVLNRKKSGEVYVEWLSIKRVLDDKGQLTHHVAVFSDITVRKAAEGRMRHLAMHDALTDLPNRLLLTERLGQAIVRARRDRTRMGLMYFDLDKFKPINDRYGHEVGDLLLKEVARRSVECVRAADTVARIGGDEFVVLLTTVGEAQDALRVAEKICAALRRPFEIAGHSLDISTSIGLAVYPEHGGDAQALIRNADAAMYFAKQTGRDQVVLYQPGM